MSEDTWHYAPLHRLKLKPGSFAAWIVATHRPGSRSACALEIRLRKKIIMKLGFASRGASTQWRGYLAAAAAVLELLPTGSTVRLCSKHQTLIDTLKDADNLREARWLKKDKSPVAHKEILKRYLIARDAGRIAVEPKLAETEEDFDITDSLAALANEVCKSPSSPRKRKR